MQKGIIEDLIVLYFLFSDMFIDSCTLIILFYVLNDFFSMQVTVSKDDTVILEGTLFLMELETRSLLKRGQIRFMQYYSYCVLT